jgi:hypothetical protein
LESLFFGKDGFHDIEERMAHPFDIDPCCFIERNFKGKRTIIFSPVGRST